MAFSGDYEDPNKNVQAFLDCIKQCQAQWTQNVLYAPYISVVQGSMMGKSRLFYTLPHSDVYAFYICLGESAIPACLPKLMKRLTSDTCTEGFYCAFLISALAALQSFLSQENASPPGWFLLQSTEAFWTPILGAYTANYF